VIEVEVFRALGEPTRLEIIERLLHNPSQSLGPLTRDLNLTRQGARRHVQVLVEARLIRLRPVGRETWVELDSNTLLQAKAFIDRLEKQWDIQLQSLKKSVEEEPGKAIG
jgi:DNA-binding transcriptional ArsR family regulator